MTPSPVAKALDLISLAVERFKPRAVVALFSGGHDSLTAATIASKHPAITMAAHLNTGMGIEETREFARATAARMGWPFREVRALEECGQDYRRLVCEQGFPGPGHHLKMYNRLKERPLRLLIKSLKKERRDKILLITGVRSKESTRRMGRVEPIQVEGVKVWCAPIHGWAKADCLDFLESEGMPRNPVSDALHMSGECLCGSFASEGEKEQIRFFYPRAAAELDALEVAVKAAGQRQCEWGRRVGYGAHAGKANGRGGRVPGPLCTGCAQGSLFPESAV